MDADATKGCRRMNDADEILIETRALGSALLVSALDTATLDEVRFQAPVGTPRNAIEKLARDKLAYVARRRAASSAPAARGGRGISV